MLKVCMTDFNRSWEGYSHLLEFSYNKKYQTWIKMSLFIILYERNCKLSMCWDNVGEKKLLGPTLVTQTVNKIKVVKVHLKDI